jgi:hypothetical protein
MRCTIWGFNGDVSTRTWWWNSDRDQTVRFAYVTSFRLEGKQTHMLCEPKTLPTKELGQRATKYCRWEIMFYSSDSICFLICYPSYSSDNLAFFFSNVRGTHRFVLITVHGGLLGWCAVWYFGCFLTLRRNTSPPSSGWRGYVMGVHGETAYLHI